MWYTPWWAEGESLTIGCKCTTDIGGGKKAWSRASDNETWVHECGYPSEATLRSQDMLNLFRFGPHHNELIETEELMKRRDVGGWITSYAWTPEKITGSVSGREARVWVYKES
jgi:hypothetical protein